VGMGFPLNYTETSVYIKIWMANPGRVAGEAEQKSPGGLIIPGFLEDNYQGTFMFKNAT
jgi:hypothetical protein